MQIEPKSMKGCKTLLSLPKSSMTIAVDLGLSTVYGTLSRPKKITVSINQHEVTTPLKTKRKWLL